MFTPFMAGSFFLRDGVGRPGAPDMYWAKAHSESAGKLELEVVTRKFGRKLARYVVVVYTGSEIITCYGLRESE